MSPPAKILHLEDDLLDAELIEHFGSFFRGAFFGVKGNDAPSDQVALLKHRGLKVSVLADSRNTP
jgi:hypothetical protein